MANEDVLIVGKLEDGDLRKSIKELVDYVETSTGKMAKGFKDSMDMMKEAMKDFAVSQKVSVDLMKESWKTMSTAFDAMFEAEKSSTGGGKGKGKTDYKDNTIGALEQEIALEEKRRKEMELSSKALRDQNELIEQRKNELKRQKGLNTEEAFTKAYKDEFSTITALSDKTIPKAQEKLRQLIAYQQTYANMEVYDKKQWNRLESAIDGVRDKIERLKKKGATGSSGTGLDTLLDIKNMMPEDSIDEIAKKMKALKNVKAQDAMESKALAEEYQRLKRKQHDLMGSSVQLTKSNNYLAQSFGYIRNRIVYALTLGAMTNFIKNVYEIRGQYELLERSLGVLVNSFERGSQVFQELNQMAIQSPFTLMELAGAAKQLTAYNFAADEVVDTTRRLADISSALGVPMERLVYNLGQIRAQTVLNARDARDFANAGLPVIKMLSDYYTELEGKVVSTGDVYARMSKKMVSYTDVMTVISRVTDKGGKFFEFQAKQAETLRVQMANLTLAFNNMLNEMGEGNQWLLTAPIKGLKVLLQNWESLNRVIKNLILSFTVLKAAQFAVLMRMPGMNAALASTLVIGKGATAAIIGMCNALKTLALNPVTWFVVATAAIFDFVGKMRAAHAETVALNEEIAKTAQEASKANLDYLNNKGNKATRELAKENKLAPESADKAWQSIEEQIKTSSDAAEIFLTQLWSIDDVNKRVAEGFNYVENIQKAQAALRDLNDTQIDVTKDVGWWGVFGEGLVSDLKDFAEALHGVGRDVSLFDEQGRVKDTGRDWSEYRDELEETAKSINEFIKEHDITDPLQITEILGRVKTIIKQKNPEIKGELESLFDVTLDKRMSYLTGGAVDENLSLWKQFMERLQHNSSATFQDITREWATNDEALSEKQQEAVDENLEYFKNTMPFYYESVKNMVEDASKLKIQIGLAFNALQLTDFQKQVKDRITKAAPLNLDFGNKTMWGTQNDDLTSWVDTQQKAIKGLREDNKLLAKDTSDWSKKQQEANNKEIKQRKNLLDLFHQSYEADKKTKGGSKKDVLGEALTKEVQLITDIRKRFNEYQKMGMRTQEALANATDEYDMSLKNVKATLAKFGIDGLEGVDVATMQMQDLVEKFKEMRSVAQLVGNTKGVEAIEKAIATLNVEINKVNYKRITDGLNNELGKLKDEYELAIELDANPELGNMFAQAIGMSEDDIAALPHTIEDVLSRAQASVDKWLKEAKIETPFNILSGDVEDLRKLSDSGVDSDLIKEIENLQKKIRELWKKNASDIIADWDKLLEKYAEYETKIAQIQNDAAKEYMTLGKKFGNETQKEKVIQLEADIRAAKDPEAKQQLLDQLKDVVTEIAGDDDIVLQLVIAIDKKRSQESAKEAFEQFQNSPEWVTATGDLTGMTNKAIGGLIHSIEQYKKKAKDLSPKQIKQINNALKNLYKQQRGNNPFRILGNAMDEARSRMYNYQVAMDEAGAEIERLISKRAKNGKLTEQEENRLKNLINRYNELSVTMEQVGKVSAEEIVSGINNAISAASQAASMFTEMMDALGGKNGSKASENIKKVVGILEKGGQGAAIGAQIGGGWGALIGGVAGTLTGVITQFADTFSGNAAINEQIEKSALSVKQLTNEYKKLAQAAEEAYGVAEIGAKRATITNKELQLAELRRQLYLEQSRKAKNRDEDKIEDLKGQIIDLELEIKNATNEIVNDLLNISSVGDVAENLVSQMIEAFKKGEDYMGKYADTFEDMIDNMIMKAIVGEVIGKKMEEIFKKVEEIAGERAKQTQVNAKDIFEGKDWELAYGWVKEHESPWWNDNHKGDMPLTSLTNTYEDWKKWLEWISTRSTEEGKIAYGKALENLEKIYGNLISVQPSDVEGIRDTVDGWKESVKTDFEAYMEAFGIMFGQDKEATKLSALQQGIQGITETQAGALEAYWNANTQQQYVQSDYLLQIRDTLVGFDLDVQVATLSQILLQLQTSYQTLQAMASMMNNWQTAAGNGIRVELLS